MYLHSIVLLLVISPNCVFCLNTTEIEEQCLEKLLQKIKLNHCTLINIDSEFVNRSNTLVTNYKLDFFINQNVVVGDVCYYLGLNNVTVFSFEAVLQKIHAWKYFNPDNNFLIITKPLTNKIEIKQIFEMSWKAFIINVVVIDERSHLHTYYPLSKGGCKDFIPQELGHCLQDYKDMLVFIENKVVKLINCTIRIYAIPFKPYVTKEDFDKNTGSAMVVLREAVKFLKMDAIRLDHDYNSTAVKLHDGTVFNMFDKLPNGSYSGLYRFVYEKTGDIIVGPIGLSSAEDFDFTYSHLFLELSYFVPTAKPLQKWMNILFIYPKTTWLCIVITIIVNTIFWHILSKMNLTETVFFIINTLLTTYHQKHQQLHLNIFYIFWITFAYVITSIFKSMLISYMFTPIYEKQIMNFQDLVNSELEITGLKASVDILKFSADPLVQTLLNRTKYRLVLDDDIWQSLVDGHIAVYTTASIAGSGLMKYSPDKVHVLHPFVSLLGTMVLKRGNPFTSRISTVYKRFHESGLILKWKPYIPKNVPILVATKFEVITVENVQLILIFYFCGVVISSFTFICECFIYKLNKFNCIV